MRNLTPEKILENRCKRAALELYPAPHQYKQVEAWVVWAYHKCIRDNVTPRELKLNQAPNIEKISAKRKARANVLYYPHSY